MAAKLTPENLPDNPDFKVSQSVEVGDAWRLISALGPNVEGGCGFTSSTFHADATHGFGGVVIAVAWRVENLRSIAHEHRVIGQTLTNRSSHKTWKRLIAAP